MNWYIIPKRLVLLCAVPLLFLGGAGVMTGQDGRALLISSEHSANVRQASFQLLFGNGLVNAGDASREFLFSEAGEYIKGRAALAFRSESFELSQDVSSIEFDARFRFAVNSSEGDVVPTRGECNGKPRPIAEDCEFLMLLVRVVNSVSGETVYSVTDESFKAKYGERTEEVAGGHYKVDVPSLREKLSDNGNDPLRIEVIILTSSTLMFLHQSEFLDYKDGVGSFVLE